MIDAVQLRMARAALGISVRELARLAEVDKNTISRCEAGGRVMSDSLLKLERTLVGLGVVLIGGDEHLGPGVRLRNPPVAPKKQISVSERKRR